MNREEFVIFMVIISAFWTIATVTYAGLYYLLHTLLMV